MDRFNIFLSCSPGEMHGERQSLKAFIGALNHALRSRGLRLQLHEADRADKPMDRFKMLVRAQLCVFLMFNRAGAFACDEFDIAMERRRQSGEPAVMVFFRRGEGFAPEPALTDFKRRVTDEGAFLRTYEHFDAVRLNLMIQLSRMDMRAAFEFENGVVTVNGMEIMRCDVPSAPADDAGRPQAKAEEPEPEADPEALRMLCEALIDREDYAGCIPYAEHLLKLAQSRGDDREAADACAMLADCHDHEKQLSRAEAAYLRAKALYERLEAAQPGWYAEALADVCFRLGRLYAETHRGQRAEAEYLRAREIYEALAGDDPAGPLSELAGVCMMLGDLYADGGRPDRAEAEFLRAKALYEALIDDDPGEYMPNLAAACVCLGKLYADAGRRDQAEAEYLHATAIGGIHSDDDPDMAPAYAALTGVFRGELYADTGRWELAEAEYLRVRAVSDTYSDEMPDVFLPFSAYLDFDLAMLYCATGRREESIAALRHALDIYEKLAETDPDANRPKAALIRDALEAVRSGGPIPQRIREMRNALAN